MHQLTEWNRNDEKLIQAVKKGSLNDVQQLLVDTSKRRADPVKLDPNRGTTAYVIDHNIMTCNYNYLCHARTYSIRRQ